MVTRRFCGPTEFLTESGIGRCHCRAFLFLTEIFNTNQPHQRHSRESSSSPDEVMPSIGGSDDFATSARGRQSDDYAFDGVKGWRKYRVLRPGRGMFHDVRRRLPYYWTDITDAFTYRTLASTIRMYFVKFDPANTCT